MTKDDLFAFIKEHKLAVLSSISPQGTPQSALVGIAVTPDLEIVFDTLKSSRKYLNLKNNSAAAFVVGCTGDKTLQFEGMAFEPATDDLPRYQSIYFEAYPDAPSRLTWHGICYFVVRPKWIRFSDYGETPPLVQEFDFAAGCERIVQ